MDRFDRILAYAYSSEGRARINETLIREVHSALPHRWWPRTDRLPVRPSNAACHPIYFEYCRLQYWQVTTKTIERGHVKDY